MGESGEAAQELPQATIELMRMLVLAMVAMVYLFLMLILFTARWLQAGLAESNGFGEEFRALTLGRTAATVTLILVGLGIWLQQDWMLSLMFLLVFAFTFQGLAVVHARFGPKRQGRLILTIFYTLLLLSKQAIALTAVTGVIDNWLVFRKKSAKPNDENEL
jgi:CDP-diglyceride synthetase